MSGNTTITDYVKRSPAVRPLLTLLQKAEDTLALQQLSPLSPRYLPWSDSSIRPSALVAILNDILLNKRSFIVELGGGLSTLYIARLLEKRGSGRLLTIEHDADWLDTLRELLAQEGLLRVCSIVHAPLAPCAHSAHDLPWYTLPPIVSALSGSAIDLLLVDGPPAYRRDSAYARQPAVAALRNYFAPRVSIVLDDIGRSAERSILREWADLLGVSAEIRDTKGGIGLITVGDGTRTI